MERRSDKGTGEKEGLAATIHGEGVPTGKPLEERLKSQNSGQRVPIRQKSLEQNLSKKKL